MAKRGRAHATKRSPIPVRAAPQGGDLCLRCGLCCDGTLFSFIALEPDEGEYVRSLGLEVQQTPDGGLGAPQPCPAFRDGCCSRYGSGRPSTCGTYQCRLLRGYTSEASSLDDCLAVVRLVRSLSRELEVAMALPTRSYTRASVQAYLTVHQPWADPAAYEPFLVAFHRLHALGKKYFGYGPLWPEEQAAAAGEVVVEQSAPV